jgi:CBS domain-containing protein
MIESGIRQLPVFENKNLVGFITDENIIKRMVFSDWGRIKLRKIMTKSTIESNRSIGALLNIMREQGISHIPITNNGKVVGIVSIQDILDHVFQPKESQTHGEFIGEKVPIVGIPSRSIMSSPVITVSPEISIKDAIKEMSRHDISSLVVIDKEMLVGITTKLDFLEPISQMELEEEKLKIQFGVKGIEINPNQKKLMIDEFNSFIHKYKEGLEVGTLFVYIKTHGKSHKGIPLIHCRLQLKTARGSFFSSGEGYGVETTFQVAMERLDRRLLRSKELSHNPKFARDFLLEMSFS